MITIVVLNCSTSWCQSKVGRSGVEPDTIPSTGGLEQTDSLVLIPISAIKVANAKMIELKYEKEINNKLVNIIKNDSIVVYGLNTELDNVLRESDIKIRKIKKERNIFIVTTVTAALISLLLLIK